MSHILTCTSCGQQHLVSPSQAGQELECSCGEQIRIPTLRGIRELPAAVESEPRETAVSTQATWGGWRGPALAITTGIALIAFLYGSYLVLQRLSIDTSFTEESAIQVGDELLDEYGPYELSYVFNTYQNDGLGPKTRPNYYYWNEYAKILMAWIVGMACVALVSGGAAFGIWWTTKKNST